MTLFSCESFSLVSWIHMLFPPSLSCSVRVFLLQNTRSELLLRVLLAHNKKKPAKLTLLHLQLVFFLALWHFLFFSTDSIETTSLRKNSETKKITNMPTTTFKNVSLHNNVTAKLIFFFLFVSFFYRLTVHKHTD